MKYVFTLCLFRICIGLRWQQRRCLARLYYVWQFAFNLVFGYPAKKVSYLRNLYTTVYLKDLIDRNNVKKNLEFDSLVKVMASSVGSPCNPNKLSNTFKSVSNADLSPLTIDNYLGFLQEAFLIEKAMRYDIKGKSTSVHCLNTIS